MGNWYNYSELARFLSANFRVILPERRGRGLSPRPFSPDHAIGRDVEDVEAVLDAENADMLFGLSSGAMIALESARELSRLRRVAVYEPPFYPGGLSQEGLRQFNLEVERGDLASALVSAGRLVGIAPLPVRILPKSLARVLTGLVISSEARKEVAPYLTLQELLPSMRYDFADVQFMNEPRKLERLGSIDIPLLLLSGARSPGYLRQAIRNLNRVLPRAQHIEFHGLDHSGAWNKDRGGKPAEVAPALASFFGA